ncbi:ferric reductase-like transmembrane domain-containing protein [Paenibacillus sp.]|uniref:ferric reductase-like transmembrane domain-containing protein n=1 Tax=Paenibacillus sp. TaxID=58172 RepID=UPI00283A8C74|nr:ferric reductase-like transmembrane domain-containing protein [Paenibacillus sp.]
MSTWGVIKAAGLTSYLLIWASIVLGAFSYGATVPVKVRKILLPTHQFAGWLGFIFGLLHGAVLMIDTYQPFLLSEILIPFTAEYKPVATGFGTLALYMIVAILISSDMIKKLGKKVWRSVHLFSYPLFFFSLIHGLGDGSDSGKTWAFQIYAWSLIIFVAIVLYRVYIEKKVSRKPVGVKKNA